MSNDEEKRLWIQNESGHVGVFNVRKLVLNYQPEGYDEKTPLGPRYIEVVPVTEHERVVAELKASIEHSETKVGWLLHDNEKNVRERDAVIAKQAKVIEVLKACILKEDKRCGIWHEGRKAIDHVESIGRGEA